MKEEAFDHMVKSKLETLNMVPEIIFDEEVLWKRIEPRIKRGFGNNWYLSVGILVCIAIGLFYYFDIVEPDQSTEPIERTVIPFQVDTARNNREPANTKPIKPTALPFQVDTTRNNGKPADTIVVEKMESSIPNKNMIKQDTTNPSIEFRETPKVASEVVTPSIVHSRKHLELDVPSGNNNSKTLFRYVEKKVARVHVYRPKKIIGFGWVFNLKGNGKTIAKVKNGGYEVLELSPGKIRFSIKQKTVDINLEAGKTYYLRASLINGIPIGKPHLEEVSETYVEEELSKD